MSSIANILSAKKFEEPKEVKIIKDFVQEKFQTNINVKVNDKQIIVSAPSSALIGALRLHSHELTEVCQTNKRITFIIGI